MKLSTSSRTQYGGWGEPTKSEHIEDANLFERFAVVTEKDFTEDDGSINTVTSMCFTLKSNKNRIYVTLDRNSGLTVGDKLPVNKVVINTYEKGDQSIERAMEE